MTMNKLIHAPALTRAANGLRTLVPPGLIGKYILLVGLVGIAQLGYAVENIPSNFPEILVALFIVSFILEWAPIKLTGTPLQGSTLSVSAASSFAALLILGPAGSIIVNSGSALSYCLKEKRPFYKRLFTTAAFVSSSGASGLVYLLAGGRIPVALESRSELAAGLAAVAYFLTNSSLISSAISLSNGRPFRSVLANWQLLFLQVLTTLAIGLVMALAQGMGSPQFVAVSSLLIFPWYSIYFYVQKSRQLAAQAEHIKNVNAELEVANKTLDHRVKSLRALHNIGVSLNSSLSLQAVLQQILTSVVNLNGADASAVFLNGSGEGFSIAGQIGLSHDDHESTAMTFNGSAVRALREGRSLIMDQSNFRSDMLSAAAEREGIKAAACIPLSVAGEIVGGLEVSFKTNHVFSDDDINLLHTLAEQAAVAIQNAQLLKQVHESYLSTLRALAAAVEAKDPYTRGHSEVVRQLAIVTARRLGLTARQIELLNIGALFHDIGKIGISESILHKKGSLSEEEWSIMRQHTVIGEGILSKIPALADILHIVRHHHERLDGKGYPDGISAREDLLAAIVCACDAYQAMLSDRPYRRALSQSMAVEELARGSGTQFVPEVIDAIVAAIDNHDIRQQNLNLFETTFTPPNKSVSHDERKLISESKSSSVNKRVE